jgi:putative peptidoglycan lipid II flippase
VSEGDSGRGLARTTALLLPAQIVLRAGEAALPPLLATWFGHTTGTDVYYFSWAVFAFAGSLVFSAYQDSAVVPILAETRRSNAELLPRLRGSLLVYTVLVGGALSALIGLGATVYFRTKYGATELALALSMVVPFCFYLVALAVKTLLFALLSAEKRFFYQPVCSAAGVAGTLACIELMRARTGVASIPIGQLLGEVIAILSAWTLGRRFVPLSPSFEVPEPMRRFVRLIASEVSGGAVTRINPVVDQLMAGMANVEGGGTLLRYSGDVGSLPTSLLQASLLPVLLTHLSEDFAEKKYARIRSTVRRALVWVIAAALGTSAILYEVKGPLLRLAFQHGNMDAAGVERMGRILPYHLVGVASFGALLVLARAHVAIQNSAIMVSMGILNAVSNAVFNVILLRAIGLEGIALSTSMMQTVVAVVFYVRLERKLASLAATATATATTTATAPPPPTSDSEPAP